MVVPLEACKYWTVSSVERTRPLNMERNRDKTALYDTDIITGTASNCPATIMYITLQTLYCTMVYAKSPSPSVGRKGFKRKLKIVDSE
jgi:hypothetical protein